MSGVRGNIFPGVRHAIARRKAARKVREKGELPERGAWSGIALSRERELELRDRAEAFWRVNA